MCCLCLSCVVCRLVCVCRVSHVRCRVCVCLCRFTEGNRQILVNLVEFNIPIQKTKLHKFDRIFFFPPFPFAFLHSGTLMTPVTQTKFRWIRLSFDSALKPHSVPQHPFPFDSFFLPSPISQLFTWISEILVPITIASFPLPCSRHA